MHLNKDITLNTINFFSVENIIFAFLDFLNAFVFAFHVQQVQSVWQDNILYIVNDNGIQK